MKFGQSISAIAVTAALAFVAGPAAAQKTYTYGQWLPPKHNVNLIGLKPLFEDLKTKNLPWRLVTGGQLFSAKATLKSVGNRTAEAGLIVPSYSRTGLKHAFIPADLLMLGESELAMNAAALETYFFNCPNCLNDYKRAGTIYLAGYAAGGYSLLCRKPVTKVSDVAGLKVRTTGALGRWARALGGTPVSMTMGDVPEAIKRGQIDCIIGPIAWIKSYPIADSITHVLDYNFGAYSGLGLVVMNRKAWNEYSDEQKRTFWSAMPATTARTTIEGYMGDNLKSRALAKKMGITVTPGGRDIRTLWEKHKKNEVKTAIKNAKKLGVTNADNIAGAFLDNVAKWTKIVDDAGLANMIGSAGVKPGDLKPATDKYAELLAKHIYNKIDPTKF